MRADGGHARLLGGDPWTQAAALHRRLAYVPGDVSLWPNLSGGEVIDLLGRLRGGLVESRRAALVERFELDPRKKCRTYSKGNRQKVALVAALSSDVELLILDEPTSGLDPAMTEEVLQALVAHVASEEMTVFFSSHQISEVDQIADQVAIVDRGRAVVTGALDDLRESYRRIQVVFEHDAPEATFRTPGAGRARRKGRVLTVLASHGADDIVEEARVLNPASVDIAPVTLKEIFLETVVGED